MSINVYNTQAIFPHLPPDNDFHGKDVIDNKVGCIITSFGTDHQSGLHHNIIWY